MNNTKECNKCKQKLPANNEFFAKCKANKDGLKGHCKECNRKLCLEWRSKNKEHIKTYDKKYQEENKDRVKQWKKDWAVKEENKEKKRRYYHNNKESMQVKHKEWLENNKEKVLKRQREYYKEKPEVFAEIRQRRRSLIKNVEHNFTWEEWEVCVKHFENKCAYCGKQRDLQQEHFISLANGGEYTSNNIIPACKSCNSSKCDRDFFEWYPSKPYYSKQRENKILKYLSYDNNKQQLALFK